MTAATALPVRRYVEHVMGMPISLAVRGDADRSSVEAAWAAVMESLREVDRVFSTYRADSFVSRFDRDEVTVADCPPEVAEVLVLGERARVESGGAFDVRLRDAEGRMRLDPSGVVKGWAVERAARAFDALPDTDFCLSAGGDMVCRVRAADRPAWRIGIEDPADPTRVFATVDVRNGAVATSGAAHRGAHIQDPRTGATSSEVASVTVLGDDLTWADIDATAAYAQGADALRWLESRTGRGGLVVWADGSSATFGSAGPRDSGR